MLTLEFRREPALPDESRSDLEEVACWLSRAAEWRRENMPAIESRQGYLLLLWLLKHPQERQALLDFYESSHFSEPTKAIKAFTGRGLATVETDWEDARRRYIRATPKLAALAEEYSRVLAELVIGLSTCGSGVTDDAE